MDGSVIRAAALRTSGSTGPSGLDAYGWRCLCSSFKSASVELCCSIAILAHCLCTSFVDPEIVFPLVSCRLIALDKNPGVHPIGVGEATDGWPHLGAAIGSTAFVAQYVSNKITTWISELKLLSSFAITQPHAAYSVFAHGLVSKWLFVART